MVRKPTQEQLTEQFRKIPMDLRKAISSSANADTIFEIAKKHGLLVDKTGELAAETGLLMLGVTHPDEFVDNLAERLKIDRASASKIADDINREIFTPVREHLRGMFGGTSQKEILEERLPKKEAEEKEKIPPNLPFSKGGGPTLEKGGAGGFSSLEDLEAELERVLAEEQGNKPLSVIKQQPPQNTKYEIQDTYKGTDPYREQVEEDLPNVRPKAYQAPAASNKKEILEERLPETGRLISKISLASGEQVSGFKFQVSRTQPTPTPKPVEEDSPFSPLHEEKNVNQRNEKIPPNPGVTGRGVPPLEKGVKGDLKPDGTLPKFRGINMQSLLKEQGESKAPEAPAPIEPIREPEKPASAPQQKLPPQTL